MYFFHLKQVHQNLIWTKLVTEIVATWHALRKMFVFSGRMCLLLT